MNCWIIAVWLCASSFLSKALDSHPTTCLSNAASAEVACFPEQSRKDGREHPSAWKPDGSSTSLMQVTANVWQQAREQAREKLVAGGKHASTAGTSNPWTSWMDVDDGEASSGADGSDAQVMLQTTVDLHSRGVFAILGIILAVIAIPIIIIVLYGLFYASDSASGDTSNPYPGSGNAAGSDANKPLTKSPQVEQSSWMPTFWSSGSQASTSLTAAVQPGATVLEVGNTAGFAQGDRIVIGLGSQQEENVIAGFGSIILQTPLKFAHPAGTSVQKADESKTMFFAAPTSGDAIKPPSGGSLGGSRTSISPPASGALLTSNRTSPPGSAANLNSSHVVKAQGSPGSTKHLQPSMGRDGFGSTISRAIGMAPGLPEQLINSAFVAEQANGLTLAMQGPLLVPQQQRCTHTVHMKSAGGEMQHVLDVIVAEQTEDKGILIQSGENLSVCYLDTRNALVCKADRLLLHLTITNLDFKRLKQSRKVYNTFQAALEEIIGSESRHGIQHDHHVTWFGPSSAGDGKLQVEVKPPNKDHVYSVVRLLNALSNPDELTEALSKRIGDRLDDVHGIGDYRHGENIIVENTSAEPIEAPRHIDVYDYIPDILVQHHDKHQQHPAHPPLAVIKESGHRSFDMTPWTADGKPGKLWYKIQFLGECANFVDAWGTLRATMRLLRHGQDRVLYSLEVSHNVDASVILSGLISVIKLS